MDLLQGRGRQPYGNRAVSVIHRRCSAKRKKVVGSKTTPVDRTRSKREPPGWNTISPHPSTNMASSEITAGLYRLLSTDINTTKKKMPKTATMIGPVGRGTEGA